MAGTTNFLQHNPSAANQETDGTYNSDPLRTGGIGVDDILPSPWLNKIWFQSSTFVAAIAAVIAGWGSGYTITDTSISVLQAQLTAFFTSISSLAITQNAGLISTDGTSGARSFYQASAPPQTTPPISPHIYHNTSGAPLLVTVSADGGGSGFWGSVYCDATSTPTTLIANFCRVNAGSTNPNYYPGSITFVVPPGYYYGITVSSGGGTPVGSNALDTWTEWELA